MYFRDAHKVYRQLSCSNYDKFATHQQQEIIKEKEFCTTNGRFLYVLKPIKSSYPGLDLLKLFRRGMVCSVCLITHYTLKVIPQYCTAFHVMHIKNHVIMRISKRAFREHDIVFQSIDQLKRCDGH